MGMEIETIKKFSCDECKKEISEAEAESTIKSLMGYAMPWGHRIEASADINIEGLMLDGSKATLCYDCKMKCLDLLIKEIERLKKEQEKTVQK